MARMHACIVGAVVLLVVSVNAAHHGSTVATWVSDAPAPADATLAPAAEPVDPKDVEAADKVALALPEKAAGPESTTPTFKMPDGDFNMGPAHTENNAAPLPGPAFAQQSRAQTPPPSALSPEMQFLIITHDKDDHAKPIIRATAEQMADPTAAHLINEARAIAADLTAKGKPIPDGSVEIRDRDPKIQAALEASVHPQAGSAGAPDPTATPLFLGGGLQLPAGNNPSQNQNQDENQAPAPSLPASTLPALTASGPIPTVNVPAPAGAAAGVEPQAAAATLQQSNPGSFHPFALPRNDVTVPQKQSPGPGQQNAKAEAPASVAPAAAAAAQAIPSRPHVMGTLGK